jgi:hypothetical protein
MSPSTKFWPSLLLSACSLGCASAFHETHYFRSVDQHAQPVNYYRVTVDGQTVLSSSRYLSGYFDEQAVNTYFNEYTQPQNAHFSGTATPAASSSAPKVQSLAGSLDGRSLVMILSSNSDDIATGISSLAQSNDVAATLTAIVSRGQTTSQNRTAAALQFDVARGKVLAAKGTSALAAAGDSGDRASTESNVVSYAEDLASFLSGSDVRFSSLQEAVAWLAQHKSLVNQE